MLKCMLCGIIFEGKRDRLSDEDLCPECFLHIPVIDLDSRRRRF